MSTYDSNRIFDLLEGHGMGHGYPVSKYLNIKNLFIKDQ